MNKKISVRTPTSLEKYNTRNSNNNNNNNNYSNNKNNTSDSKGNNNTLITIMLLKTDAKFNYVAVREENVLDPKK